jgi:hypothetical protein
MRYEINLYQVSLHKLVVQSLAKRCRTALDDDTGGLEGGDLGISVTLAAADDSA